MNQTNTETLSDVASSDPATEPKPSGKRRFVMLPASARCAVYLQVGIALAFWLWLALSILRGYPVQPYVLSFAAAFYTWGVVLEVRKKYAVMRNPLFYLLAIEFTCEKKSIWTKPIFGTLY